MYIFHIKLSLEELSDRKKNIKLSNLTFSQTKSKTIHFTYFTCGFKLGQTYLCCKRKSKFNLTLKKSFEFNKIPLL